MLKRKQNLILAIVVLLILVAPISSVLAQTTPPATERALEIVYPIIPGDGGQLTSGSGLPEYVRYIFKFAIAIIGLIILGVMIYSGIQYVLSTGSADKLLSAKNGILSSFLGALILIGAFVLFNTINPDLTKLGPIRDLQVLDPIVIPGIYLCNYNPDNVSDLIKSASNVEGLIDIYKDFKVDLKKRIEVARELRNVMQNGKNSCYRVGFSTDLTKKDLNFTNNGTEMMFSIPKRIYADPDNPDTKDDWEYNYGIIFHEENNWRGKCSPNFQNTNYYDVPGDSVTVTLDPFSDFNGTAKSVTLFERPTGEILPSSIGVGLFQCLDHNTTKNCPTGVATGGYASFPMGGGSYGGYITKVTRGELEAHNLEGAMGAEGRTKLWIANVFRELSDEEKRLGTRSVIIDPEGGFFAIMFSGGGISGEGADKVDNNFTGKICEVISKSDNNLLDQPIGRCGIDCEGVFSDNNDKEILRDCVPCLKSMIVVKGNVIY